MNDLISRHAVRLIESDSDAYPEVWNHDYERGFTDAIIRVIGLPSVNQWIPCSERLPADDDYRPCYGHDDGAVWWINDIGQMGIGWYYISTKTWAYYDEISSSEKSVGNVVAWMPLPEPYEP